MNEEDRKSNKRDRSERQNTHRQNTRTSKKTPNIRNQIKALSGNNHSDIHKNAKTHTIKLTSYIITDLTQFKYE